MGRRLQAVIRDNAHAVFLRILSPTQVAQGMVDAAPHTLNALAIQAKLGADRMSESGSWVMVRVKIGVTANLELL